MPNSGYQCLINSTFLGSRKEESLWLDPRSSSINKSWERFLSNKYSRHMNTSKTSDTDVSKYPSLTTGTTNGPPMFLARVDRGGIKVNSIAPFATLGKPTCGFYFSRTIDHKKRQTGIPPSDLVKWRYFVK